MTVRRQDWKFYKYFFFSYKDLCDRGVPVLTQSRMRPRSELACRSCRVNCRKSLSRRTVEKKGGRGEKRGKERIACSHAYQRRRTFNDGPSITHAIVTRAAFVSPPVRQTVTQRSGLLLWTLNKTSREPSSLCCYFQMGNWRNALIEVSVSR